VHNARNAPCPNRRRSGTRYTLPAHDATAEHVRVPPKGPLGPPAPRGPRVEPRGACAGHNRALRVAQAVPGGEAHRAKMGDVHAEHALQGLMDPTVSWGRLGVWMRGEGKFCSFFHPSPKIFWCLRHLPQAAVSRYYV
jgi:hypothetical protein